MVLSSEQAAIVVEPAADAVGGEKATAFTRALWSRKLCTAVCTCTSHRMTALSSPPETAAEASPLRAAQRTQLLWPLRVHSKRALGSPHTLTVLSSEAVIRCLPSREKPTLRTPPECPFRTVLSPLALGSHSRTVLSAEAEATMLPLGAKQVPCTGPLCPTNLKARSCGRRFQSIRHWSALPLTSCLRSGLNETELTSALWPLKVRSSPGSPGADKSVCVVITVPSTVV